jgi:hypothetical protein
MTSTSRRAGHGLWFILLLSATVGAISRPASASEAAPYRQALDEAWWTGPLLASGASTLPKGRALIEPYLYDSKPYGRIDADGDRHDARTARIIGARRPICSMASPTPSLPV